MDTIHALILGLVQGLTEYLPVSSSGHLEIGKAILGGSADDGGLTFDIVVHVATVLSTVVVLWREIVWIFEGLFKFKLNSETRYVINIIISMIPVGIVGLFFKEHIEALYEGHGLLVTGFCLLVTAVLLVPIIIVLRKKRPFHRQTRLSSAWLRLLRCCPVCRAVVRPLPPVCCWATVVEIWLSFRFLW